MLALFGGRGRSWIEWRRWPATSGGACANTSPPATGSYLIRLELSAG